MLPAGWTIMKIGGTFTATGIILTGIWKGADYAGVRPIIKNEFYQVQLQLEQTSQSVLYLKFQMLQAKRAQGPQGPWGGLTFEEQQELCRIAAILGYNWGVPGC